MIIKFSGEKITDQKRLVRGEQLLLARSVLRARDGVHHARWRILTIAGGSPKGEITAIRELMPKAYIVAVDRNPACLDAAIEAGVDDVVQCDLTDWSQERYTTYRGETALRPRATARIAKLPPFDLMVMDLCGGVNNVTREICHQYKRLLAAKSVFQLTFSYGRDVVETFIEAFEKFGSLTDHDGRRRAVVKLFEKQQVPNLLAGRLMYLFPLGDLDRLLSVMVYRGNEMPMCSCLLTNHRRPAPSFSYVQVEPGDFELAVAYPEAANLYDCPQDRIESLRRQFAAVKAVITRRAEAEPKAATSGQLFPPER